MKRRERRATHLAAVELSNGSYLAIASPCSIPAIAVSPVRAAAALAATKISLRGWFAERVIFGEFYPRGLTAFDALDEIILVGALPYIIARYRLVRD